MSYILYRVVILSMMLMVP